MRHHWLRQITLTLLCLLFWTGCATATRGQREAPTEGGGDAADAPSGSESAPASGSAGTPGPAQGAGQQAGTLTAGAWDDNLNFALYQNYLTQAVQSDTQLPALQAVKQARHARTNAVNLDLAFVVDATGSMGDEIQYLKAEIDDIVQRVIAQNASTQLRLALVLYRDEGDAYVTRAFDFTASLTDFQGQLAQQDAEGGGDYPEAMEKGVAAVRQLTWRGGDTVQILFHIADAPPHAENYGRFLQEVQGAASQGIVMFPVSASGVNSALQYLMRSMAQVSGGRYVFLTNDSGVGNDHEAPTVPCYLVEHLNQLMVDLIVGEMTGQSVAPADSDVVRTVGKVQGNVCSLDDGGTATLY